VDSRKARDGEYLESVGHYDPRTKLLELQPERIEYWTSRGALLSDTVTGLVRRHARQHAAATAADVSQPQPETPIPAEPPKE
jgi:small subunit ribosomal protein S16